MQPRVKIEHELTSLSDARVTGMKNWLTIVSIVWLMGTAGVLLIGRQQYLYNAETNSTFMDPTPMPNVP